MNPLLNSGYRRQLNVKDIYLLPKKDNVYDWYKLCKDCLKKEKDKATMEKFITESSTKHSKPRIPYIRDSGGINIYTAHVLASSGQQVSHDQKHFLKNVFLVANSF